MKRTLQPLKKNLQRKINQSFPIVNLQQLIQTKSCLDDDTLSIDTLAKTFYWVLKELTVLHL